MANLFESFIGVSGAQAAGDAADVQQQSIAEGRTALADQFQQSTAALQPFQDIGQAAFQQQAALSGVLGAGQQANAFQQFQQSPSQQFIQERAQRNLLRNSSAIGGLGGGNVRSALVEQGAGFASQDLARQQQQLGALSGVGFNAASKFANLSQQQGVNQANLFTQSGQAQAGGILGAEQATAQGAQNLIGGASALFGIGI